MMEVSEYGMDRTSRILRARASFVADYCKARGWIFEELTFDQIREIREQEGWKHPDLAEKV